MAHILSDRVKETSSTTGTGTFTLTGAVPGFISFATALTTNGDTTWYCAYNANEWEVGLGTRVDSTHLARTIVLKSSNANSIVTFTSAPTIFLTLPSTFASAFGLTLIDDADAATARATLGLGNVENKSSSTILGEISSGTITTALGFTPVNPANPTFTGSIFTNGAVRNNQNAMGALDIDCSIGNVFTKTINGASVFTFSNPPVSGNEYTFKLFLTHTSGAVTWPGSVSWPGSTAPTLTTGKLHIFFFTTYNGGTNWYGASLINY